MANEANGQYTLSAKEIDARGSIGRYIIYWALGAVTLLGVASMALASLREGAFNAAKDVLTMLLPMIGAWVGTVLAFYFSRENYQAAAQNNATVLGMTLDQRLDMLPATSAMRDMSVTENKFVLASNEANVKLIGGLLEATNRSSRNRILVLDEKGTVKYIIHRSLVDKFIATKAIADTSVQGLTLQNLLDDPEIQSYLVAFGTLGPNAKLSAAKALIDGNPKCSDVVVTDDGTRGGRAIGWITNVAIGERAHV